MYFYELRSKMDMSAEIPAATMNKLMNNVIELVSPEELTEVMGKAAEKQPTAYIGFEPSGLMHIGQLTCVYKVRELLECGFRVTFLLADWHAQINDKLGGEMKNIHRAGDYLRDVFASCGMEESENMRFVFASEIVDRADYWEKVIKVAKNTSLARMKRAMSIMGRSGDEVEVDSSRFIYPAMQVADIFDLGVDVALGGMDQRKAHMLARDVASKLGFKKPIAMHTPLLSALTGQNRMDPIAGKMSKSNPDAGISIHDSPDDVRRKLKKAFCPMEDPDNPVMEIVKYLIFPFHNGMKIDRSEKWGGALQYATFEELKNAYGKELHPQDLKKAVADYVINMLEPIREYFKGNPKNFKFVKNLKITK